MLERVFQWLSVNKINRIAKKVRNALLSISFYRKKLKENSVNLREVKRINSIEKLDRFLQKYGKVSWVTERDLIGSNFSSHLSLVQKNERIWIQMSSGYSLIEKVKKGEDFFETVKKFRRKKVAFTESDLQHIIEEVYLRGLRKLYSNFDGVPTISIFGRLVVYGGSGTYPFASLVKLMDKFPVRILPYSEPFSEEQTYEFLLDSIENGTNGIIATPSVIGKMGKLAMEKGLIYPCLTYVGIGGFKPSKKVVELAHHMGAKLVINGYSVQECMPLGCVASGVMSSEDKQWETSPGLMVLGNLCYVRIVDKNGENVSEGEEGEIRITSPFEGTFLLDYAPGDVTTLVSLMSSIEWKRWRLRIPFPILSYDIVRRDEKQFVKVSEFFVSLSNLCEVLSAHVGYEFLIYNSRLRQKLMIFIPKDVTRKDYENIKRKIRYISCRVTFGDIRILRIERDLLKRVVYPYDHHKPHNIAKTLPRQLQNFEEK